MNLANSVRIKTQDLVSFRDPTIQTYNVLDRRIGGVATRIANKDGMWETNPSDIGTAATHDEIKNISEKLAYRKYIKDLDFETSKILERENIERGNIKEIETRLSMTQMDEHKMENIEERENIDDIPTQKEMTRSEHISTSKCKNHGPKVNSEPDPSPSDSSDSSSSSNSAPKKKKSKKEKKRRKHRKDDLSDPSSSDDFHESDSSEDSHYRRRRRFRTVSRSEERRNNNFVQ